MKPAKVAPSEYEQKYLECLEKRRPQLEALLRRIGFSWQDAENAAQEAIIEAVKLIKTHRVEDLRDRGKWLRRVAINKARSNTRNHWRGWVSLPEDGVPYRPFPHGEDDRHASLWAAFDRLPPKLRELFAYCYLEGHTFAEAAEEFGIGLGVVSRRLRQARELLRAELSSLPRYSARAIASVN